MPTLSAAPVSSFAADILARSSQSIWRSPRAKVPSPSSFTCVLTSRMSRLVAVPLTISNLRRELGEGRAIARRRREVGEPSLLQVADDLADIGTHHGAVATATSSLPFRPSTIWRSRQALPGQRQGDVAAAVEPFEAQRVAEESGIDTEPRGPDRRRRPAPRRPVQHQDALAAAAVKLEGFEVYACKPPFTASESLPGPALISL